MRKLTAGLFMPLDGAVESPNLWQFDSFDNELGQLLGATMGSVDTAVLGRIGFQEWSSYRPNTGDDNPFSSFINALPNYVASTTLSGDLGWNATLIDGDVVAFLTYLEQTEGGEISLGSTAHGGGLTRTGGQVDLYGVPDVLAELLSKLGVQREHVPTGAGHHEALVDERDAVDVAANPN